MAKEKQLSFLGYKKNPNPNQPKNKTSNKNNNNNNKKQPRSKKLLSWSLRVSLPPAFWADICMVLFIFVWHWWIKSMMFSTWLLLVFPQNVLPGQCTPEQRNCLSTTSFSNASIKDGERRREIRDLRQNKKIK